MNYTRIKSAEKKFFRVSVSEEDLARFAKKIANAINSEGKQISIRIETADKKEVFMCNDPEFFRSDEMPVEISSVAIAYQHYDEPLKCELSFKTGTSGSVGLRVEGTAPEVPGLFEDLANALNEKRIFGHALVAVAEKAWFVFTLPLIISAFIFLIFDLWLDLWRDLVPEFGGSNTHVVIAGVGWFACVLTLFSGSFWAEAFTKKFLTPVQFTGRIADPTAKHRRKHILAFTLVLLPLIVGVIASAAYEAFNWWLSVNSG